ncbi:MAG TPA: ubiquinone/menaquinone biosynthesis methyltransferase [Polyangiales bacterium]|nr:ubiquinone/menaquinone biosynthesis methyltransferase [Polyangiales bacterium]
MTQAATEPNSNKLGQDPDFIRAQFTKISKNYDRANDAMTLGMIQLWRKRVVAWSSVRKGDRVLDCATGTGELAFDFKRAVGTAGRVVGSDFCPAMLEVAGRKAKSKRLDVQFELGDATKLPYANGEFDVVSIGFGIRNVSDPVQGISEMARVTRPGGRVMVLETGAHRVPFLQKPIELYFELVVPRLGGLITGHRSVFEYLHRSSSKFPSQEAFVDLMMKTGRFTHVECKNLMGGASFMYRGHVK